MKINTKSLAKGLFCALAAMSLGTAQAQNFRLQLLHTSDLEGGVSAIQDAPRFAAITDHYYSANPTNTILLSAGDNVIPGPFFTAAGDASVQATLRSVYQRLYGLGSLPAVTPASGRIDMAIMNTIGFDASVFGNHEWDAGTTVLSDYMNNGTSNFGANFPYLSSNLNFGSFNSSRYSARLRRNTEFRVTTGLSATAKLAYSPFTFIVRNGETLGVVGITTPMLESISSPSPVTVRNPGAGTNNMTQLASVVQPFIDSLTNRGINKIIIVSHLQQFSYEQELMPLLRGVDICIAGGSSAILADDNDRLRTGDVRFGTYPFLTTNADGNPVAIVSSGEQYKYLGRLVIDFTSAGIIVPSSVNANESGVIATDAQGLLAVTGSSTFVADSKADLVEELVNSVADIVTSRDAVILGRSSVYLDGRRETVRRQESNAGNLTADAQLWYAKFFDPEVKISLKNGGGIRGEIGYVNPVTYALSPTAANPASGKLAGQISRLDAENTLRFNNALCIISLKPQNIKNLLEHGINLWTATATPGAFPQVSGLSFSFDPTQSAGNKVRNIVVTDLNGRTIDVILQNGVIMGDRDRIIKMTSLSFLVSTNGDSYPFSTNIVGSITNLLNASTNTAPNNFTFTTIGTEQDAFAEYMFANHNTVATAFNKPETPYALDTRIQNLNFRTDAVIPAKAFKRLFRAGSLEVQSNWANNLPGLVSDSVVITANATTAGNNLHYTDLTVGTSMTLTVLAGDTIFVTRSMNIMGNIVGNGVVVYSNNSGLGIRGGGNVNNLRTAAGTMFTGPLGITGFWTPNGATNLNNQVITLKSSAAGTSYLNISSTPTFTNDDNFTQERHLTSRGNRQGTWYWLGIPTNNMSVQQFSKNRNFFSTNTFTPNTNITGNSSLWGFSATATPNSHGVNAGWVKFSDPNFVLNAGNAARVWFSNSFFNQTSNSVSITGRPVISGVVNGFVTVCNTGCASASPWNGLNFLGNPFPHSLEFDAFAAANNATVANEYYLMDGVNNRYVSYVNGVGTNGGTSTIGRMQGIMLRAIATGPIVVSSTNQSAGAIIRRAAPIAVVRIALTSGSESDEVAIRFDAEANSNNQAMNMANPSTDLAVNNMSIYSAAIPNGTATYPLTISNTSGLATLTFTGLSGLGTMDFFVFDAQTNTYSPITEGGTFTFDATNNANRYSLVVTNNVTSIENKVASGYSVYPNPAKDVLFFNNIAEGTAVTIVNTVGKTVLTGTITDSKLNLSNITKGIYFVNIAGKTAQKIVVE
jgi:2',3'-cyclic-nucleotide 2'-phosphodiesterase (5'-nucleotidase family)